MALAKQNEVGMSAWGKEWNMPCRWNDGRLLPKQTLARFGEQSKFFVMTIAAQTLTAMLELARSASWIAAVPDPFGV
jgi:hypothetical protein